MYVNAKDGVKRMSEYNPAKDNRKLLVSIWRCGGKLYRSYTDGTIEVERL